jgi:hypothetical protein
MMTMTEEKHTPNAISFVIEMPATKMTEMPEIKKRLEDESAAYAPTISLEQIEAKLMKAGEKRRLSLHQQSFEEKRNKVTERKSSLEQAALEHNTRIESTLSQAEKNREAKKAMKLQKIQEHLNKVDEIRKSKSIKEQTVLESMQEDIKQKLEAADMRR